jgi:protein-tyrosine phosphatase
LLRDFAPWPFNLFCNIYDPFGLGEGEFRRCYKLMGKSLEGLKDHF